MTVKHLKNELEKYPENMDVFIDTDFVSEFRFALVDIIESKEITFSEEPEGKRLDTDKVIVLSGI